MESKIDKQYLYKAIDELIALLGVKETIGFDKILPPVDSFNDTERCIKDIANNLNLPIKVNVSYGDKFKSTQLVNTDKNGKSNEGITAQVHIPSNLPMYGMPSFNNFPVDVIISKNCATRPNAFMAVMAHELSHIVLHSLNHQQKNNEFYTDLTAMILGFSAIMKVGRKFSVSFKFGNVTQTQTTKYGYLDDYQFDLAYNRIRSILEENEEKREKYFEKLKKCRKYLNLYNLDVLAFEKYLLYVGKNHNNIKKEDEPKIAFFYQPYYSEKFHQFYSKSQSTLNNLKNLSFGPEYYNNYGIESLNKNNGTIEIFLLDLKKEKELLSLDSDILKKYINKYIIILNNINHLARFIINKY